jgi:hypothetical protein
MFGSKKETINKPILGNKNYGERLVLSYLYDEGKKGYVLNWVWSGDNTVNRTNNTFDINIDEVKRTGNIPNISDLSETLREETTTVPDANTPDATSETTTVPDATSETTTVPDATSETTTVSDATRDSIESVEYERPQEISLGGKRLKKSRTTRRKSRKSGGKRRSRRGSRTK